MNNEAYLVPQSSAGWALGVVTVTESGEVETDGFLTHFERYYPDEKWLMLFRTQHEAKAYIVTTFPADVLEECPLACTEFSAAELLGVFREYPDLEGVLFDPGSDGTHYVPAAVLIDVLEGNLGEPKGDAA